VRFRAWHAIHDVLAAYDAESDEITQAVYEEALADGEPWAEEAYEHRSEAHGRDPSSA
jgi:hypothetical protein